MTTPNICYTVITAPPPLFLGISGSSRLERYEETECSSYGDKTKTSRMLWHLKKYINQILCLGLFPLFHMELLFGFSYILKKHYQVFFFANKRDNVVCTHAEGTISCGALMGNSGSIPVGVVLKSSPDTFS